MGNFCNDCLKKQNIQPDATRNSRHIQMALNQKHRDASFSKIRVQNSLVTILSNSINQLDVDLLVLFADSSQAVMKNPFVRDLSTSLKVILLERLKQKQKLGGSDSTIKISDPFFQIPIKKLVVVRIKVWNGKSDQKNQMKKVLDKFLNEEIISKHKISLAIVEPNEDLGYILKIFQLQLFKRIKLMKQKLGNVYYLTKKGEPAQRLIFELANRSSIQSSEQFSNKSNYY